MYPRSRPVFRPKFAPIFWVLLPAGTDGQITSWGEMLAGAPPVTAGA